MAMWGLFSKRGERKVIDIAVERITDAPWQRTMLTIHPAVRGKEGFSERVGVADATFNENDVAPGFLKMICECSCTRGKYETEQANADFIVVARNAFAGDPEALAWWEKNRAK